MQATFNVLYLKSKLKEISSFFDSIRIYFPDFNKIPGFKSIAKEELKKFSSVTFNSECNSPILIF
jgi:hypothetical protein